MMSEMVIASCLHENWLKGLSPQNFTLNLLGGQYQWKEKHIKMKKSGDWEKSVLCENTSQPIKSNINSISWSK